MAVRSVVAGGDVFHAVGVGVELVAFAEARAGLVLRVIDGDGVAAVFAHEREAGDIGGAIADVDHALKGDGAEVARHVIIHILMRKEQAFVNSEDELGLRGVADDTLREADAAFAIFRELTAEDGLHMGPQRAAFQQFLQAGGDDVVFDLDPKRAVLGGEDGVQFFEHVRQSGVELKLGPESAQLGVGRRIRREAIQQCLQVGQLRVVALLRNKCVRALPQLRCADAEVREHDFIRHVAGAQGLIVVVNETDGGLRHEGNFELGIRNFEF